MSPTHARHASSFRPSRRASAQAGRALLPLRIFLAFTFIFAGLQKLANPNFFNAANPSGIYAQMIAADRISPLHSILGRLLGFSTLIGVLIALGEVAVGLGALLGLWTRLAAFGGMALSFMLFLTVSFHSAPYYTGADIVFLFAWTPLLVVGSGGVLSADVLIADAMRRRHAIGRTSQDRARAITSRGEIERRTILRGIVAGVGVGATLATAGLAAGIGRLVGGAKPIKDAAIRTLAEHAKAPSGTTTSAPQPPVTTTSEPQRAGTTTSAPQPPVTTTSAPQPPVTTTTASEPPGTAVGAAADVPIGGFARFQIPSTGNPGIVLRPSRDRFLAFDAVCPHAGCTVSYAQASDLIVCPCHGSEFTPNSGAVERGPSSTGLTSLTIVEGGDGQLYVN